MPCKDKSAYSTKRKYQAQPVAQGYEKCGIPVRAWATGNTISSKGRIFVSGHKYPESHQAVRKGGRIGGHSQPHAKRVALGKKPPQFNVATWPEQLSA